MLRLPVVVGALLVAAFPALLTAQDEATGFTDHNVNSIMNRYGHSFWSVVLGTIFAVLIWKGYQNYRWDRSLVNFAPAATLFVVIFGFVAWVDYFGDHGAFFTWPLVVLGLVVLLAIPQFIVVERRKRERAQEEASNFDTRSIHADAKEASADDERRAGL